MKGEHVLGIALPGDRLAGGGHFQINQVGNGPGGAMLARQPLRIKQGERTRLRGDDQPRMQQLARGVSGIDIDPDRGFLRPDGGGAAKCPGDGQPSPVQAKECIIHGEEKRGDRRGSTRANASGATAPVSSQSRLVDVPAQ